MDEPLVDCEGYPRADVDLYQVRTARHNIICEWPWWGFLPCGTNKLTNPGYPAVVSHDGGALAWFTPGCFAHLL